MKEGIHPNYEATEIRCACGEVISTSSTKKNMRVDICSNVIRFLQVNKSLLIPAEELTALRSATICSQKTKNNEEAAPTSAVFLLWSEL
jgi:large subunit ribosomal protein L31